MATIPQLRLGMLGLGFMGSTHLKALRCVDGARLAAVCSKVEQELTGDLSAVRGNFGGPGERWDFSQIRKYRDPYEAIADPELDAVDICLPTDLHSTIATAALRAGKHVLVEKPMALDGAAADRMLEEAQKHGRVLMTGHVLRFWPDYVALRAAVQAGELGAARVAVFRRRCAAPGWGGWLLDPARSGGGAFDLLIHDADICLYVFGIPEAVSATGYVDQAAGIDCLDARLFYPGGLVVTVTGGWHHPEAFPFSMEYTVTLDGGTIDFSSNGPNATLYARDGTARPLAANREGDAFVNELGHFIDSCRSGHAPELCPPRESAGAVKLMRLMLEARQRNGERMTCSL
jgi:predicted dehydrogenase